MISLMAPFGFIRDKINYNFYINHIQNSETKKLIKFLQRKKNFKFDCELLILLFRTHTLSIDQINSISENIPVKIWTEVETYFYNTPFMVFVSCQDIKVVKYVLNKFSKYINPDQVNLYGNNAIRLVVKSFEWLQTDDMKRTYKELIFKMLSTNKYYCVNTKNNLGLTLVDELIEKISGRYPDLLLEIFQKFESLGIRINFRNIAKDYYSGSMRAIKCTSDTRLLDYIFFNFKHDYYLFNSSNENIGIMCIKLKRNMYDPNVRNLTPVEFQKNMNCAICLETLTEKSLIYSIKCKHLLHYNCIFSWFKKSHSHKCPICRAKV